MKICVVATSIEHYYSVLVLVISVEFHVLKQR